MKIVTTKRETIVEMMISLLILTSLLSSSLLVLSRVSNNKFAGVVYGAQSGVPIYNAEVSAFGVNGSGFALTDSAGDYIINEGLGTGNYTVEVTATGYLTANKTDVHVEVGVVTLAVNFYLNLSGGISGRVTDMSTSLPLRDVLVFAVPFSGGGPYGSFGITNANGDYNITTNLATGVYNVTVFYPTGYFSKTISGVSVTAGAMASGIDLALEKSGIISGRITTPSNAPLANVSVSAYTEGFLYFGSATTNATGYYRITSGLGTGNYTVTAFKGFSLNQTAGVMVTAGFETSNVNMWLEVPPPPPTGYITGKVTDMSNGEPIAYASVDAFGTGGFGSASTDGNGDYVISSGLGTGNYTVTASAAGYNSTSKTNISVIENQTTSGVDFQLSKIPPFQSGSISGNVQGTPNPVPEFNTAEILILTAAVATTALMFAKKKITTKTQ